MNMVPIIYENDEIYIINKQSGLAVQGGSGVSHSLDSDFSMQVGQKVFLVHRLDKDTCGLMIVAKTPKAACKWTKLISSKLAQKEYIAVCAGSLKKKSGVIKEDVVQHGEAKSAITNYNVEKEWEVSFPSKNANSKNENEEYDFEHMQTIKMSLVKLKLETGRMHQIRIHLAKQGCPVAGDDQHGNFKINKLLKKHFKIKHMLLASVKLSVPFEGKVNVFEIELPDEFKKLENREPSL